MSSISKKIKEYALSPEFSSIGSTFLARKIKEMDSSITWSDESISAKVRIFRKNAHAFNKVLQDNNMPPTWSAGWIKTKEASVYVRNEEPMDFTEIAMNIQEAMSKVKMPPKTKPKNTASGNLFVPTIFDLHLGKLSWGEEVGENYDMKIATRRFQELLTDLIQKSYAYDYEHILFPIGNDFFNSDKAKPFPQTTNGTPQTDDVRWQKLFSEGVSLIVEAIEILSRIAPVTVVTVFSNHDHERVFYLGEVLTALYKNDKNITVDNSPKVRKYFRWGINLIGLAHGHNEKPQDLPLIMAQEAKDHWGETVYREWLLGHLHHKKILMTQTAKDYMGVQVTYMSSPSAPDAWHFERAFIGSVKGAEGLLYSKEEGKVGVVVSNLKK